MATSFLAWLSRLWPEDKGKQKNLLAEVSAFLFTAPAAPIGPLLGWLWHLKEWPKVAVRVVGPGSLAAALDSLILLLRVATSKLYHRRQRAPGAPRLHLAFCVLTPISIYPTGNLNYLLKRHPFQATDSVQRTKRLFAAFLIIPINWDGNRRRVVPSMYLALHSASLARILHTVWTVILEETLQRQAGDQNPSPNPDTGDLTPADSLVHQATT
jgi:hypothetical protein